MSKFLTTLMKAKTPGGHLSLGQKMKDPITPPQGTPNRNYTVNTEFDLNNYLIFTCVNDATGQPDDPGTPLRILIPAPQGAVVTLKLSAGVKWQFTQGVECLRFVGASEFGVKHPAKRYAYVVGHPPKADSLTFYAPYLPLVAGGNPKANYDSMNIFIDMLQPGGVVGQDLPLQLIIDPDIKNPGDGL